MKSKIDFILKTYEKLVMQSENEWMRWVENPQTFSLKEANQFFIGVMLDQGQKAKRAWDGGKHFIENHFSTNQRVWTEIYKMNSIDLNEICQSGFHGYSYALRYSSRLFPKWLKANAEVMIDEYEEDPRKIWNGNKTTELIYNNFKQFSGIGDALARMATFILVRKYGQAGGLNNRKCLKVKPDIHVSRLMHRLGFSKSEKLSEVKKSLQKYDLVSPADFDAVLYFVGKKYCKPKNPNCRICPLKEICIFEIND